MAQSELVVYCMMNNCRTVSDDRKKAIELAQFLVSLTDFGFLIRLYIPH